MNTLQTQENIPERKSSKQLVEFSKIRDLIKREKNLVQPHDSSIEPNPNDHIDNDIPPSNQFSTPIKAPKTYLMTPENQRISVISEEAELEKMKVEQIENNVFKPLLEKVLHFSKKTRR